MTTQMIIAQCLMVLTLVIMITGMTPIYITAITGAAISAIVAGFPLAGSAPMTIAKMINSGLNPVIADMTGILLFIGIMQATGFLDVIVRDIVLWGNKLGGGPGVCTAGELRDILSAPRRSTSRMVSISRIPPPTVKGMNTCSAVRSTTSNIVLLPSCVALISKKVISSAPSWL